MHEWSSGAYSGVVDRTLSSRLWNLLCVAADFRVNHLFVSSANQAFEERFGAFPSIQVCFALNEGLRCDFRSWLPILLLSSLPEILFSISLAPLKERLLILEQLELEKRNHWIRLIRSLFFIVARKHLLGIRRSLESPPSNGRFLSWIRRSNIRYADHFQKRTRRGIQTIPRCALDEDITKNVRDHCIGHFPVEVREARRSEGFPHRSRKCRCEEMDASERSAGWEGAKWILLTDMRRWFSRSRSHYSWRKDVTEWSWSEGILCEEGLFKPNSRDYPLSSSQSTVINQGMLLLQSNSDSVHHSRWKPVNNCFQVFSWTSRISISLASSHLLSVQFSMIKST